MTTTNVFNVRRALTLYANVLFKDPLQLSAAKAKSLLEKALAANSHYLPAVYLLAEILEQELNFDQVNRFGNAETRQANLTKPPH